jgi:hypothetical protein
MPKAGRCFLPRPYGIVTYKNIAENNLDLSYPDNLIRDKSPGPSTGRLKDFRRGMMHLS